jgi:WD40 repeat protein
MASLGSGTVALLTAQGVQVYKNGTEKIGEVPINATPLSIATQAGSKEAGVIAVGAEDRILRILTINFPSAKIEPLVELSTSPAAVTALAFSPDGKYLAAGNSNGKIFVYNAHESYKLVTDRWSGHTARVTSISWNEESTHAASGSLDTNVFVWSLSTPGKRVKRLNAHKDGVNGVVWASQVNKIFSIGADAAVKVWKIDSK